MKEQQIEYENRIRQLRVDLGALKDAYLKLEKHHVSKPDKYKRVLHDKNKQINSLQQHNDELKQTNIESDKNVENLKSKVHKIQTQFDEEKLRNIMLQRDISKLCKRLIKYL